MRVRCKLSTFPFICNLVVWTKKCKKPPGLHKESTRAHQNSANLFPRPLTSNSIHVHRSRRLHGAFLFFNSRCSTDENDPQLPTPPPTSNWRQKEKKKSRKSRSTARYWNRGKLRYEFADSWFRFRGWRELPHPLCRRRINATSLNIQKYRKISSSPIQNSIPSGTVEKNLWWNGSVCVIRSFSDAMRRNYCWRFIAWNWTQNPTGFGGIDGGRCAEWRRVQIWWRSWRCVRNCWLWIVEIVSGPMSLMIFSSLLGLSTSCDGINGRIHSHRFNSNWFNRQSHLHLCSCQFVAIATLLLHPQVTRKLFQLLSLASSLPVPGPTLEWIRWFYFGHRIHRFGSREFVGQRCGIVSFRDFIFF